MKEPSKATLSLFIQSSHPSLTKPQQTKLLPLYQSLVRRDALEVKDLVTFVKAVEPKAVLRNESGLEVERGGQFAPPGGPDVERSLDLLLSTLGKATSIFRVHLTYLWLHPFTEANGRSARAIWLWHRAHNGGLKVENFHLDFYYESLRMNDKYMDRMLSIGKLESVLKGGEKTND